MIVKDKAKSMEHAYAINNKILKLITKEINKLNLDDDPAEFIYLLCHTIGFFMARLPVAIHNYAQIYGIENFPVKDITKYIDVIKEEYAYAILSGQNADN